MSAAQEACGTHVGQQLVKLGDHISGIGGVCNSSSGSNWYRQAGRSVGPSAPAAPAASAGPVGPVGPSAPAVPAAPAGPVGPVGPSAPVVPAAPAGPVGPVGPVGPSAPAGPVGPVGPSVPAAPAAPAGPVGPVGPSAPVAPVAPAGPAGPVGPVIPAAPAAPAGPVGPVAPTAPVAPVAPGIPMGPVGPVAPVGPATVTRAKSGGAGERRWDCCAALGTGCRYSRPCCLRHRDSRGQTERLCRCLHRQGLQACGSGGACGASGAHGAARSQGSPGAGRSRRTGDIGNGIAAVAAEAERIAASAAAMMMIHGKTPFHGIPFGNALLRSLYFTHALRQVCAKKKRRETVKIAGKRRGRKEKVFCGLNDGEKDEKQRSGYGRRKGNKGCNR